MSARRTRSRAHARGPGGGERVEGGILLVLVLLEPLLFSGVARNPFAVKDLLFSALLLALAAARVTGQARGAGPGRLPALPAALLAAVVAVHGGFAALSSQPALSLAYLGRLLGLAALFLLVASRAVSLPWQRRFCEMVTIGAAAASVYGLLQALHLDPVAWADSFRPAGAPLASLRIFSTFGHPNLFGAHLAMALFFVAALGVLEARPARRLAAGLGMALAVACLLLTANRGAWVGTASGALVVALLAWRRRRASAGRVPGATGTGADLRRLVLPALLALAAGVIVLASSSVVRDRLLVRSVLDDPTVKSRLLIWSGTLDMIRERPLTGVGPGAFGREFPRYRDERLLQYEDELTPVTHAHSEYLELLAETGVAGFLIVAAFVASVLWQGFRKVRDAASREEHVFATALLAGLVALLVSSLFGVELRTTNAQVFFWLLLGLLAAAPPGGGGEPAAASRTRIAAAAGPLAALGAAACAAAALSFFAGEILLGRAERQLEAGLTREAAVTGREAHAWNRADTTGLMIAGEALASLKDFAGARQAYRDAERANPAEPLVEYDLALMEFRLGNIDAGLGWVEKARRRFPRHAPTRALHYDLLLRKGLALVEGGDLPGAKQSFRLAERINGREPRALFYRGNIAVLAKDYRTAVRLYEAVLRLDPGFRPAAENLERIRPLAGDQPKRGR
jgi:putative inorganic carbon (HCO3(-)) transporter